MFQFIALITVSGPFFMSLIKAWGVKVSIVIQVKLNCVCLEYSDL